MNMDVITIPRRQKSSRRRQSQDDGFGVSPEFGQEYGQEYGQQFGHEYGQEYGQEYRQSQDYGQMDDYGQTQEFGYGHDFEQNQDDFSPFPESPVPFYDSNVDDIHGAVGDAIVSSVSSASTNDYRDFDYGTGYSVSGNTPSKARSIMNQQSHAITTSTLPVDSSAQNPTVIQLQINTSRSDGQVDGHAATRRASALSSHSSLRDPSLQNPSFRNPALHTPSSPDQGEDHVKLITGNARNALTDCGGMSSLKRYLSCRVDTLVRSDTSSGNDTGLGVSDILVTNWIEELIRFLTIKTVSCDTSVPSEMLPSTPIDEAWKGLMIMPAAYVKVCHAMGNEDVIDRDPYIDEPTDEADAKCNKKRFNGTLRTYHHCFGQEPPCLFWPDPPCTTITRRYFFSNTMYRSLVDKMSGSNDSFLKAGIERVLGSCK